MTMRLCQSYATTNNKLGRIFLPGFNNMSSQLRATHQCFMQPGLIGRFSLTALLLCSTAASANWRVVPAVGAGLEYDDNANLNVNTGSDTAVNGYVVDAGVDFINESPRSQFTFTPSLLLNRYDESDLDSNNYFANLNYRYSSQRSTFNIWGVYGDETVRTAEQAQVDFNVDDPTQIPDDNSGRTFGTANRKRIQVRPQWSYQAGERSLIEFGVDYRDVAYEDATTLNLSDYDQLTGSAAYSYNFSRTSAFRFSGYSRANHFDVLDRDLSGYGAALGLGHSISERTRVQINIGADKTENSLGENQNSSIGDISITHRMETSRVLASYRRSVVGSGNGVLTLRDSLNLNYTRQVTERFSFGGGISAYHSTALGDNTTNLDSDYYQLRALFGWNLTRTLSVDLDYRYTNIDRALLTGAADSNRINLWFRYQGLQQQ
jgi:hypothetical protein